MAEPIQCVPRPVQSSVMILSTGSVTESCVILLYCGISIVALFMCLSLVFTAVWFRPGAELFMTVLGAGDEVRAEPRRRTVMCDSGPDPEQEAKARHQAQLEQRHLQAYRNMHRLRDALCHRYAALLKDKVHSQRLLLQQRDEAARAKSQTKTKQKQKKLAFSKLQHNDSYLESLPKTGYYLVFALQKQLAQRGHLKTHHDLEDFYRCITYNRHPTQLHKSLEDVRKRMLERKPAAHLMIHYETSEEHLCTPEDRGHEDHCRLLERGSGSGESLAEVVISCSREKEEIEQMFPKMKVPTFATLQPNFMRNFQSKMPDLIIPEIPEKSRKAENYVRRLRQMHDLCLTNMAFSQRLLDREADSLSWQEERGNQDLKPPWQQVAPNKMTRIQRLFVLPGIDSKQEEMSQTNQAPLGFPKQPRSVQLSRMTSASQQRLEPLVWDKTPDPLSIDDVCQQKHVQIIDRGFKLWRNYIENTDH